MLNESVSANCSVNLSVSTDDGDYDVDRRNSIRMYVDPRSPDPLCHPRVAPWPHETDPAAIGGTSEEAVHAQDTVAEELGAVPAEVDDRMRNALATGPARRISQGRGNRRWREGFRRRRGII